jgi:hypothetical protein
MALILEIIRLHGTGGELQLGVMKVNGEVAYTTAELPWRNNTPNESCIPIGEYKIKRGHSVKWDKEVWFIGPVKGREAIEIHPGNFRRDTRGCVLIGNSFIKMEEGRTIGNSIAAFNRFMEETEGMFEGTLYILNEDG